jgi:hypothetical protein
VGARKVLVEVLAASTLALSDVGWCLREWNMTSANPDHEKRDVFVRESIIHLEDRITTVDNKGNILIGVSLASLAVSGSFVSKALENDLSSWWEFAILSMAAIQLAVSGSIILLCLLLLNPRRASPESSGFVFPTPYLMWPRKGQPWTKGADAHIEALKHLTAEQMTTNLIVMQTTLIYLIDAKYRHYRRAIKMAKSLVLATLMVLSITGIAAGIGN